MHRKALLHAVVAAPEEDAPRLVYADWLEENGDESDRDRARFIRWLVEAARLPEFDRRRCELKWQAEQLLGRYRSDWLGVLPWWADRFGGAFFRRGFVETLHVRSNHFQEEFPELPTCEPITDLSVNCSPNNVPVSALLALPGLDRVRELQFGAHDIGDEGAAALADCASLRDLRGLSLGANEIGPQGAAALARSPHLHRLQRLDLSSNAVGPEGVAALVASRLTSLNDLSLGALDIGREGLDRLLDSDLGKGLSELALSGSAGGTGAAAEALAEQLARAEGLALARLYLAWVRIGDAGVSALARASCWGGLRQLHLLGCSLGREGVRALAGSGLFAGLSRLALMYDGLEDDAVQALAAAPAQPHLRALSLSHQKFGARGMAALARARWPGLCELDLSWCGLDDEAVKVLVASPLLANLYRLDLSRNQIGPAGAAALARSPHAAGLIELDLSHNAITEDGARAFAQSGSLPALRCLDLEFNPLGDEGAVALAASPLVRQLAELNLTCCNIGAEGGRALADSPHLEEVGQMRLLGSPLPPKLAQALRQRFGCRVSVNG